MTDYAAVLTRKHKGRLWILEGDSYEGLTMIDDGPKPSQKSLDDAWPEVESEINAELQASQNAYHSGRSKLAALGLTELEIRALLGV